MDQLEPLLAAIREQAQDQADYLQGFECLAGFLLARLQQVPGYSPQELLDALLEEQRWRLEADAIEEGQPGHVPLPEALLWPFERLQAQLRAAVGAPLSEDCLPRSLQPRYPRLDGAPETRFAVVTASPVGKPYEG